MKLLLSLSDLSNFKCKELIPLECEICHSVFHKPKNLVLRGLKGKRSVSVCQNRECLRKCLSNRLKHFAINPHKENLDRIRVKQTLVNFLGGSCLICGYNRSLTSLLFHHTNPVLKSFSIARGITKKFSMEKLIVEVKKCVLLCSNCHGELHDGLIILPSP